VPYLATMDFTRKWTGRIANWGQILARISIYFEERLNGKLICRFTPCVSMRLHFAQYYIRIARTFKGLMPIMQNTRKMELIYD
jgi:hypothetical protein